MLKKSNKDQEHMLVSSAPKKKFEKIWKEFPETRVFDIF